MGRATGTPASLFNHDLSDVDHGMIVSARWALMGHIMSLDFTQNGPESKKHLVKSSCAARENGFLIKEVRGDETEISTLYKRVKLYSISKHSRSNPEVARLQGQKATSGVSAQKTSPTPY